MAKAALRSFAAVLLCFFAASCTPSNNNYELTVVDSNKRIGIVFVDGTAVEDVYSVSMFAPRSVSIEAELRQGIRGNFGGFDLMYQKPNGEGPLEQEIFKTVHEPSFSITPSDEERYVLARFDWNTYEPLAFASNDQVLYWDERFRTETLRLKARQDFGKPMTSTILYAGTSKNGVENGGPFVLVPNSSQGSGGYYLKSCANIGSKVDLGSLLGSDATNYIQVSLGEMGAIALSSRSGSGAMAIFGADLSQKAYRQFGDQGNTGSGYASLRPDPAFDAAIVEASWSSGQASLVVEGFTFTHPSSSYGAYDAYIARTPSIDDPSGGIVSLVRYDAGGGYLGNADLIARDAGGIPVGIASWFVGFSPDAAQLALFVWSDSAKFTGKARFVALDA